MRAIKPSKGSKTVRPVASDKVAKVATDPDGNVLTKAQLHRFADATVDGANVRIKKSGSELDGAANFLFTSCFVLDVEAALNLETNSTAQYDVLSERAGKSRSVCSTRAASREPPLRHLRQEGATTRGGWGDRPLLSTMVRPGIFALLLLIGCHRAPPAGGPEREYDFVHLETTGLTSGVFIPGAVRPPSRPNGFPDVMIVFSGDSDRDAVKSLDSLDTRVLLPNADGDGLVVLGVLDLTVRNTPAGPGRPASEPYQEFRLSRWYLRAPFLRHRRIQTPLDETPGVERDDRLRPEDFGGRIGGDLSRFVRPR